MDTTLALTIVWGMEGLLGLVVLLGVGLSFIVVGLRSRPSGARGLKGRLSRSRVWVSVAAGLCLIVLVVVNVPSVFRVQTIKLEVAILDVEYDGDGDETYVVIDTADREFQAQYDVWTELVEGQRVVCRASDPVMLLEPVLLDCHRR